MKVLIWSPTINQESQFEWDGSFTGLETAITKLCDSKTQENAPKEYKDKAAEVIMAKLESGERVEFEAILEDGRKVHIMISSAEALFRSFEKLSAAVNADIKTVKEGAFDDLLLHIKSVGYAKAP